LSQIKALGEPFDPNLHEAMMQGKGKEGTVVEEIEKGYKLNNRLIRPSKVVVGSGEEKEE
ncbi:MAG: nucleotide exchange factor GrpE, partial [Chloroflexi bacterium]|nr:nucleotide exchange factor GrpE [Chloroflexota bacterium]